MFDDPDSQLNLIGAVLVGALVVMVVVLVVSAMYGPSADRSGDAPEVVWSLERVNETHVAVVHDGGQTVAASQLVVVVDGIERRPTWGDVVREGDVGVVQATRGQIVQLYWLGGRGDRVQLEGWET